MIITNNGETFIDCTAKEIAFDLACILATARDILIEQWELTEEQASQVIARAGEIAFMTNEEREKLLDELMVTSDKSRLNSLLNEYGEEFLKDLEEGVDYE